MKLRRILPLGWQEKLAKRKLKNENRKIGISLIEGKGNAAENRRKGMNSKKRQHRNG